MKISRSNLFTLGVAAVVLASLFLVNVSTSGLWPYEPWWDVNADGVIDIQDLARVSGAFGTFGDSTKEVVVANWPVSQAITVWWFESIPATSATFNASGFGHVHIQAMGVNLDPTETITVRVWGYLNNPSDGGSWLEAYSFTLVMGAASVSSLTIPVPAEEFRFSVSINTGSANIYLGIYLTWA